ncbi:ATPase AAA [Carpediemonas membranifera]|uniref:ATPase AAA n=1 Tax=Carpediemonas membranifera TaxID=201153 RepID=A0A8J6E039_9EUKA|nr:ATPase AAA [Carpediemonas membranifera]|eukprot:KAG9391271.1 ATPase AAA [Carpediemonas membranifera]
MHRTSVAMPVNSIQTVRAADGLHRYSAVPKDTMRDLTETIRGQGQQLSKMKSELATMKSNGGKVAPTGASKRKGASVAGSSDSTTAASSKTASGSLLHLESWDESFTMEELTILDKDRVTLQESLFDSLAVFQRVPTTPAGLAIREHILKTSKRVFGVLFHGQAGTGKMTAARSLTSALRTTLGIDLPCFSTSCNAMISGITGDSEKSISALFEEIRASAPCVVVLTDVDSAFPSKPSKDMFSRMSTTFIAQWEALNHGLRDTVPHEAKRTEGEAAAVPFVVIVGTTENRESIYEKVVSKFTEVACPLPDPSARQKVLTTILRAGRSLLPLVPDPARTIPRVAHKAAAFTHAELAELVDAATRRLLIDSDAMSDCPLTEAAFDRAMQSIQPRALRFGFTALPDATWADLGGVDQLRRVIGDILLAFRRDPAKTKLLGLKESHSMLLYGPPGCGKTMIAQAIANEVQSSFVVVKGPEILDKFVGESERAVRELFVKARQCAPSVIFFDEIDALSQDRDTASSSSATNVVNQFLTEMDGVGSDGRVLVIGATNRPDIMDQGLLRSGRFGTNKVYVAMPSFEQKLAIVCKIFSKIEIINDDDPTQLAMMDSDTRYQFFYQQLQSNPNAAHFNCSDLASWKSKVVVLTDMCDAVDSEALADSARLAHMALEDRERLAAKAMAIRTVAGAGVAVLKSDMAAKLRQVTPSLSAVDVGTYEGIRRKMEGENYC